MIKVENVDVYGFEAAIRGMRNPMNSWDKSDSKWIERCIVHYDDSTDYEDEYVIGKNDLDLMRRLYKAGTEHRKYLRQIMVSMDITAPLYWISEFDTYKIGVTRNSCSFMHKGVSKPFTIRDFSVVDDRVYDILSPLPQKTSMLKYPYETNEYKVYSPDGDRKYRVYRNGRIFSEPFEYVDTMGRKRSFELKECKPSQTAKGYFELNLGGKKNREKWLLHRLVAYVWIDNPDSLITVDHINSDKGDNSVENLKWCSREENIKKGFETGLYERGKDLHCLYQKWKKGHVVIDPIKKAMLLLDKERGTTYKEIAEKYDITLSQANNLMCGTVSEYQSLFLLCLMWEHTIDTLNSLRDQYLDSKDEAIFQEIRCLLPCGYNLRYTVTMNYENVINMIKQRENHRLPEWNEFVEILKNLPYVKEIMNVEE